MSSTTLIRLSAIGIFVPGIAIIVATVFLVAGKIATTPTKDPSDIGLAILVACGGLLISYAVGFISFALFMNLRDVILEVEHEKRREAGR